MEKIKLEMLSQEERDICTNCKSHFKGSCIHPIKEFAKECALFRVKYKLPKIQQIILKILFGKKKKEYQTVLKFEVGVKLGNPILNINTFLAHIENLQDLGMIIAIRNKNGSKSIRLEEKWNKKGIWNRKFPLSQNLKNVLKLFKNRDLVHPNEIKRHGLATGKEMEFFKILEEIGYLKEIWEGNTKFFKLIKFIP